MDIYLFDEKNELIQSSLRAIDYIDAMTAYIPDNAVIVDAELPNINDQQAYLVVGDRNSAGHYTITKNVTVVSDYRATEVFDTTTGVSVAHKKMGELPATLTLLPRPTPYHTYSDSEGNWTLTEIAKEKMLVAAKESKLNQLNIASESTIESAASISKVPAFERMTWDIQRQESVAWHADKTTPTPSLDRIAQLRGVPAEILKQKAYKKAMRYQALTTLVAGQRQRYEDMIDAATTLKDLESIDIEFNLGG